MRSNINYHVGVLKGITYEVKQSGPYGRKFKFGCNIVKMRVYRDGQWIEFYEVDLDLSQIDFGSRSTSAYIIHTLPSARGGRKICVNEGKEPTSEIAAKDLFINWCELIAVYILSGRTPDDQINENHRNRHYR